MQSRLRSIWPKGAQKSPRPSFSTVFKNDAQLDTELLKARRSGSAMSAKARYPACADARVTDRMYGFDPYHILLVVIGASLLLGNWLPRLAFRRPPAASALLMLLGLLGVVWLPLSLEGLDPIS